MSIPPADAPAAPPLPPPVPPPIPPRISLPIAPHPLTVQPAPLVPTTAPADQIALPAWLTALLVAWLVAAVAAAVGVRVFRRRSIVGPERLLPEQSAWSLLFVFFLCFFAALFVASLVARAEHLTSPSGVLLSNSLAELLAWGLILLAMGHSGAGALRRLGLGRSQVLRGLAMGVGAILILFPIVAGVSQATGWVLEWFGKALPAPHQVLESLGQTHSGWTVALDVVAAVVIAPLAEELAFRGVLQTVLGRVFGRLGGRRGGAGNRPWVRWAAVVVASACFAAIHGVPAFVPPLFVLAVGLGYVYERTGNLWCSVAMHAAFNGLEILLYLSPWGR